MKFVYLTFEIIPSTESATKYFSNYHYQDEVLTKLLKAHAG